MKTTPTPAVEWPPGGAASSPRSASQGRAPTDFGALLDQHQARTATAEGPKNRDGDKTFVPRERSRRDEAAQPGPVGRRDERECARPAVEAEVTQPEPVVAEQESPATQTAAEDQAPPQADQPAAGETAESPAVVVEPTEAAEPMAGLVPVPVVTEAAAAPVATPAPVVEAPIATQPVAAAQQPAAAAPVVQQAAVASEQPAAAAVPVASSASVAEAPSAPVAVPVAADAPVESATVQQPQVIAQQQTQGEAGAQRPTAPAPAQAAAPAQQSGSEQPTGQRQQQGSAEQGGDQPRTQQPQQEQQSAAAAAAPRAERSQAAPASQTQPTTPLTGPAAPQAATAARPDVPVRGVRLSQAADAVENVIRLGSARGITHARLSLRPAELGGIEIRLQQTAGGLTASVVADGVQAAQALQQAGQELRRQLEAHGIELQKLDISYSGDERDSARSAQAQTGEGERGSSTGDSSTATDGGDLNPTDEETATSTLELPGGVLVDVLA